MDQQRFVSAIREIGNVPAVFAERLEGLAASIDEGTRADIVRTLRAAEEKEIGIMRDGSHALTGVQRAIRKASLSHAEEKDRLEDHANLPPI